MTDDDLQLLREFRAEIPVPDMETIRDAHAYATQQPRRLTLRRLRWMSRRRIYVFAAAATAVVSAGVFAFTQIGSHPVAAPQGPGMNFEGSGVTLPGKLGGAGAAQPIVPPTPVASAAAADALLSFNVVLPSDATPSQMGVSTQSEHFAAYFDKPSAEPYFIVEQPTDSTVADLQAVAEQWRAGPIHKVVLVNGIHVLVQGWSDGSLAATWIRGDGASHVLTWVEGPFDPTHGQLIGQTFSERAALAVAANIIGQSG